MKISDFFFFMISPTDATYRTVQVLSNASFILSKPIDIILNKCYNLTSARQLNILIVRFTARPAHAILCQDSIEIIIFTILIQFNPLIIFINIL